MMADNYGDDRDVPDATKKITKETTTEIWYYNDYPRGSMVMVRMQMVPPLPRSLRKMPTQLGVKTALTKTIHFCGDYETSVAVAAATAVPERLAFVLLVGFQMGWIFW
jgi:hypothetical protein